MQTDVEQDRPVAAGVVLFRPDVPVLARLLSAMSASGRRLYVFANGSLQPDVRSLVADDPNVCLMQSGDNVGLAAGLNAILRRAGDEGHTHVILFDQDSEPAPDLPERLRDLWTAAEAAGHRPAAVGPTLSPPPGEGFRAIRYDRRPGLGADLAALSAVEYLPTSGSLVGLDAYRAIGPFRDDFFIDGIDVEWGLRAWAAGRPSYLAHNVAMPHRWGVPSRRGGSHQIARQPPLRTYYYVRNAVAVMRLPHTPLRWRARSMARLIAQGAALVCHPRGRKSLAAFARGAAHGLTGRLGPADRTVADP